MTDDLASAVERVTKLASTIEGSAPPDGSVKVLVGLDTAAARVFRGRHRFEMIRSDAACVTTQMINMMARLNLALGKPIHDSMRPVRTLTVPRSSVPISGCGQYGFGRIASSVETAIRHAKWRARCEEDSIVAGGMKAAADVLTVLLDKLLGKDVVVDRVSPRPAAPERE